MPFAESLSLCVIVAERERAVKKLVEIDGFVDGLLGDRRLSGLQKIAPTNLCWRKADGGGDAIHVAFHGEQTLRRAKSAKRPVRRHVRRYSLGANANVRPVIRTAGVNRRT